MLRACRQSNSRLVYVSTEYVFDGKTGNYREEDPLNSVNTYARSKLAGELIALSLENALVVRTSFCHPRSWKFPRAFIDQYTSRDSVDVIAPEILAAAHSDLRGIVHIGTERKSVFELARRIDPRVLPMSLRDVDIDLPVDTSLDCSRWQSHRRAMDRT